MTICAENRVRECQARMGGCLGYDCGHYLGRGEMDQSGCEWLKCEYASRDKDGNPICLDQNEYENEEGEPVCGKRPDAILINPGHAPEGGE